MKALVIRTSALGDLLLLTGPIQALKSKKPDVKLHLLTSELGAELFAANPNIDKCHVFSEADGLVKTFLSLRKSHDYDFIFDMQAKPKTLLSRLFLKGRYLVIDKQSRARRQYVKNRSSANKLDAHRVQSYWRCFQKAWPDIGDKDLESLRPMLYKKNIIRNKNSEDWSQAIVIHPYASQKNKEWPHFNELITSLASQGHTILIVGQSEKPLNIQVQKVHNLTNQTSVSEMLALIKSSRALISTDSGPMHAGVALGKPTVALFGPTTHHLGFAPLFKNSAIVEVKDLECRPCDVHGGHQCPLGHHHCMEKLTVSQVEQSLTLLLENSP